MVHTLHRGAANGVNDARHDIRVVVPIFNISGRSDIRTNEKRYFYKVISFFKIFLFMYCFSPKHIMCIKRNQERLLNLKQLCSLISVHRPITTVFKIIQEYILPLIQFKVLLPFKTS